jgi:hypothetical protein
MLRNSLPDGFMSKDKKFALNKNIKELAKPDESVIINNYLDTES